MSTYLIDAISPPEFDEFIAYLNEHLGENGKPEVGYFQPLSRSTSSFPVDREAAFRAGLKIPVGEQGWRRAWAARGSDGQILGHIDLRGHSERHTEHRCLLGMGVHRICRRQGIGSTLIQHAKLWADSTKLLEQIDLQVLSENQAAVALYRQAGFTRVGEIQHMFKIDDQYFSYTTMTVPVHRAKSTV
jgi:ribosomal protein S18 acetylase RimI-like enzyme